MASIKELFSLLPPPVTKKITTTRTPSSMLRTTPNNTRTKPNKHFCNNITRNNSSQKPPSIKPLKEKPRLPHAHAPEGAEFHRRRFSFVQCRNQSSQTEPDIKNDKEETSAINKIKTPNQNKNDEQTLEAQIENNLAINEVAVKTDRSSQCGIERSVKRKPIRVFRKTVKPVIVVDPDCPPGHQAMSEEERLQMLEQLKSSYESNLSELNKLPICVDTLRVRSKRMELENKLKQIESNVKIFSKPKVYVKIDV